MSIKVLMKRKLSLSYLKELKIMKNINLQLFHISLKAMSHEAIFLPTCNATHWRSNGSCKEDFLVWHHIFATSLATKNSPTSCIERRSSFYFSQHYATSWSMWHPHCNLSCKFLRRNQSQYNIIRMPLLFWLGGRKI